MRYVCVWTPAWATGGVPAEAAAAALESVPRVAVEARGVLWMDARGLPTPEVAAGIVRRLADDGHPDLRAGAAALPAVAEAAARSGRSAVTLVPRGRERDFLAPLGLGVLDPDERTALLLEGLGIRHCGELASLPRDAVEVRAGPAAGRLWRLARGDDPRVLFGPYPRELPHATLDFVDYAVRDAERLAFTAHAVLAPVCAALAERGERARALLLELPLEGGGIFPLPLRIARPTAERAAWMARLRTELETLRLPDAAIGVRLRVEELEGASAAQGDLFDRGFASSGAVDEVAARLVDTVGPVFVAPDPTAHPLAERAALWTPREATEVADGRGVGMAAVAPALTLQLLPRPRRVQVRAVPRRDHLLPTAFLDGGGWREVAEAAGPERVSGGHDEAAPYAREYFQGATDDGRLAWLYRDAGSGAWYLHGWWE